MSAVALPSANDVPDRAETDEPSQARVPSDSDLVQHCLDGDARAWRELVERYSRLVYSIPRQYGLSQPDSEEVLQNVWKIVVKSLKTIRHQAKLSAWLITITHHETERVARSISANACSELRDFPRLDGNLQRFEEQEIVYQAISRLTETDKCLIMAFLKNPRASPEELAEACGIAETSVGKTKIRCFRKLERILRELDY